MNINQIIKQTKDYVLKTNLSTESGNKCYSILNKQYEVIEVETYLLPQALKHIDDLQSALDAFSDPTFFQA
jgi:hypothetical protein